MCVLCHMPRIKQQDFLYKIRGRKKRHIKEKELNFDGV